MSAFHNGNQDLAVFSNLSYASRGKEWKDPFKHWQGSVAMRAQELGGGSGPPVPTKGPNEGCFACYRLRVLYICSMPLHTFATRSFCYGVDFHLDSIPISNHSISVSARYEVGL